MHLYNIAFAHICTHVYVLQPLLGWSKWIYIHVYKKSSVVVLHMDDMPTSFVIEDILVFHTDMYYQMWSVLFTSTIFMLLKHISSIPRNMSFVNLLHFMTHVLAAYSISSCPNSLFIPLKYQLVVMVWSLYVITLLQLSRKRSGTVIQTRSPRSSWNMKVKWVQDEF